MRWIITTVVVVLLLAGAWFLREPLMGLFFSAVPEPVPEEPAPITPTTSTYASSTLGYSFEYPSDFDLDESYAYPFSETKTIPGVAVAIGGSAQGTNLSSDTKVSVEQLVRAATCTADIFMVADVMATTVTDTETQVEYSLATSSSAGAGNVYDEVVYAIPGSKPCTAVRYQIHSTNIGNYPEGTVTEYNQAALIEEFNTIRRSLKFVAAPTEAEEGTE